MKPMRNQKELAKVDDLPKNRQGVTKIVKYSELKEAILFHLFDFA